MNNVIRKGLLRAVVIAVVGGIVAFGVRYFCDKNLEFSREFPDIEKLGLPPTPSPKILEKELPMKIHWSYSSSIDAMIEWLIASELFYLSEPRDDVQAREVVRDFVESSLKVKGAGILIEETRVVDGYQYGITVRFASSEKHEFVKVYIDVLQMGQHPAGRSPDSR